MKDFMMIFIGADYQELGLSPEELQGRMGKWFAWNDKMERQGIVKEGNALVPVVKRVSGPDRTITDGPFAEGKELVGGYYVVSAENAEAVIKIAEDYPDYDLGGTVEIREVMVFDNE
ncbi:MAG: YciI family protein [Bacteroidota bacterium]